MKRKPGIYYIGDRVVDRAWNTEGTVVTAAQKQEPLSRVGVEWDNGKTTDAWIPSIMLSPKFVEKLVKKVNKDYWVPKRGQRVKIPSIGIKGTVEFVSINELPYKHFYPIQVLLDKPYDDTGHRMYRVGLNDIKLLKKKDKEKPKKVAPPPPPEDDDILWDDDELEWD